MNKEKGSIIIFVALIVIAGAIFLGPNINKLNIQNVSNNILDNTKINTSPAGVTDCGTLQIIANQNAMVQSTQAKCIQNALNNCSPATISLVEYNPSNSKEIFDKSDIKILNEQNGLCLSSLLEFDSSSNPSTQKYTCNFPKTNALSSFNKQFCGRQSNYDNLTNSCSNTCCKNAVSTMEQKGFLPLKSTFPNGISTCPAGTKTGKLSCSKTNQWCEMTSEMLKK
ncbi:MAG: hypothetical protein NT094_02875 [Candidatus Staskawiczbacteria bacterium]|nr:hypothetical protein [Candidatus Staskawiczbacteria bacterium]